MSRPSWDKYFMKIAHDVATRSTCLSRQVGAVIVKNRQILTTGYNGAPKGIKHCSTLSCLRSDVLSGERLDLCRGVHAEMNAIVQAAVYGVSADGSDIYCTTPPCLLCAKMIINAGVKRVFAAGAYSDMTGVNLLEEAGILVTQMEV